MTTDDILKQLEQLGSEQTKKVLMKHGAREPFFGVKVADLKKIVKKVGKNHKLSLELYATGNSDAMYLAGLIADEAMMTREDLNRWVKQAYWYMISEYTVPWVAAETPFGFELALDWINSDEENIAAAGWSTLSSVASLKSDEELDSDKYFSLLQEVKQRIHTAPNRVRYAMNNFVIAVGGAIAGLNIPAKQVAETIGKVNVDMGGTACKVPLASQYIKKVEDK
ncbi:MAG: DNA alkylation repair protein, partial [Marinilabiliales bacterium]